MFEPACKSWDGGGVRASAIGDVIKVWVWALGSLVIGLWLTPVAYNGGKALAELSASKDFNGVVNKVAVWSGEAGLVDFFRICWPLAALVFLFPLIGWLRLSGKDGGQPLRPNRWGPLQAPAGLLLAFGACALSGHAMAEAWRGDLVFDIVRVLVVAAVTEVFFRGVVLGIFLRAMKALPAIALAALMSGGIRFILGGFGNAAALDGETLSAMELTGAVFGGGNAVQRLAMEFLPWFAIGCVLGLARWRTASLWLPVGLLMGWLLAERLFRDAAFPTGSLRGGIIPLIAVLAIGALVHLITHGTRHRRNACV